VLAITGRLAQEKVPIAFVVKENLGFSMTREVTGPERDPLFEQVAEVSSVDVVPGEWGSGIGDLAQPPVVVAAVVEEDFGFAVAGKVARPHPVLRIVQVAKQVAGNSLPVEMLAIAGHLAQEKKAIAVAIKEHLRLAVPREVAGPEGVRSIEQVAENGLVHIPPGKCGSIIGCLAQPPVVVATVVEEDLSLNEAGKVAGPNSVFCITQIPERVQRHSGPGELVSVRRPQPPIAIAAEIKEDLTPVHGGELPQENEERIISQVAKSRICRQVPILRKVADSNGREWLPIDLEHELGAVYGIHNHRSFGHLIERL
jgi:hypothetical protein